MIIEITRPETEALLEARLRQNCFATPEEVILEALRMSAVEGPTGAVLIAAMQASPHKDIEIAPSREPMPVREVSF